MTDRDDQQPSFDPRSWGPTSSGGADADRAFPSFDPRTWLAPADPPPARAGNHPAPPARPYRKGSLSRRAVAAGSSAAIILSGAVVAWMARPARPQLGPVASFRSETPVAPGLSSRTIIVPTIADLAPSLLATGLKREDAMAAATRTAAALGADAGELRVSFSYREAGSGARLDTLTTTRSDGTGFVLTRSADDNWSETRQAAAVTRTLRIVRGELDAQSFYSSAVAAGISDVLVSDFANAFQFDFDLQREVAPGDIIEAGFEQGYSKSGDEVGAPILVYASLSTAGKSRALYRFRAPGDKQPEWFDSNGRSTRRALMRTPVEAARISSGFGVREHPILGFAKMHRGTDFAAPRGTPIYAAGDATVEFAGPKGPNGNFVKLRHDNGWETLYLHMNRIWPGVAAGSRVAQGQQIGEVGTTGRSTGPHLHYEVHIDGQAVNPLSIDTGTGRTLSGSAVTSFQRVRDRIDARRAAMD